MNVFSGESQRLDAATQTDMAEFSPRQSRGDFQGYDVDCEQGRSIVVNCTEDRRVSFAPQSNGDRVVISVEPLTDERPSAITRSYTVNLISPASNRLSVSDTGSTHSSVGSSFRDFDISLLSSYRERPLLQLSPEDVLIGQSRPVAGMTGMRISGLPGGKTASRERLSTGSAEGLCFRHGSRISAIAAQIDSVLMAKKPASGLILNKLNVYNPASPPLWYRERYNLNDTWMWRTSMESVANRGYSFRVVTSFMLNCFAKWVGWAEEAGKCKKLVAESETCLDARFMLFLLNDVNGFERLSEVSQTIACVERDLCETFQGKVKGDDVILLYETLSFKSLKGLERKDFHQGAFDHRERYRADCDAGVVFFLRELCQMIKEAEGFDKYQSKKKEILAKCSRLGLLNMDQPVSKIALLIACIDYNLAVHLIEKEYCQSGLSEFDPARRVGGKLSGSTDYDRFSNEELGIMQDLLKLIDALEQEVQELLSNFEKDINGQPRTKDYKSFEQRVLHLSPSLGGYVSDPLRGIKATLLNILDKRIT